VDRPDERAIADKALQWPTRGARQPGDEQTHLGELGLGREGRDVSRSKRLIGVADERGPRFKCHLKVASAPQIHRFICSRPPGACPPVPSLPREAPRLCRGGSRSLTFTEVHPSTKLPIMSRQKHTRENSSMDEGEAKPHRVEVQIQQSRSPGLRRRCMSTSQWLEG
jgi:hypothetical protein